MPATNFRPNVKHMKCIRKSEKIRHLAGAPKTRLSIVLIRRHSRLSQLNHTLNIILTHGEAAISIDNMRSE
jgi:hypothetical protein